MLTNTITLISWTTVLLAASEGFTFGVRSSHPFVSQTKLFSSVGVADETTTATINLQQDEANQTSMAVRAPLKFIGPYPCLGLTFPELATSSQRARNSTGVSLDFVIDTAANTNTINGQVAKELDLSVVGEVLPGVGAGGSIGGGSTYLVGNCQLEGIPKEDQFTFMEGLTASALPVASPAAAGLLSLSFLHCFEGGVQFQWGDGESPPSITFYGNGESDSILENMMKVDVVEMPITRLPTINVTINNVTIPALLDTGSPITVLNAQAAKKAGVDTINLQGTDKNKGGNPFTVLADRFRNAQETAQAAARGDVIAIAGSRGEPVQLLKSTERADVGIPTESSLVDFGSSHIYVGNLPGLAALEGLGDDSPPAAVLGMDVLRLRKTMLFHAKDQKVFF